MNVEITDLTRRLGRTQPWPGWTWPPARGVRAARPERRGQDDPAADDGHVIPPTSGTLRLLGRDPGSYGPRREIRAGSGTCPRTSATTRVHRWWSSSSTFALLKEMPTARIPAAVAAAVER